MTNRTYAPEVKAAVMAALLQGQSINSLAREYKIPKGTIGGWKVQAEKEAAGVVDKATQKKEIIGELLISYLEANLKALRTQAEQFSDTEWLKSQSAADVAVLHGVMTDKAIRLLEAFGSAED